jgi:hypothetical protein
LKQVPHPTFYFFDLEKKVGILFFPSVNSTNL